MTLVQAMMIELAILFAASFVLSSALAYGWWTKVRVRFVREQLLEIRCELWLKAFALDGLDDPAYREARGHLRSQIHMANLCGIPVMEHLAAALPGASDAGWRKSQNVLLQRAIDEANEQSACRLVDYMVFWRASGLMRFAGLFVSLVRDRSFSGMRSTWPAWVRILKSPAVDGLMQAKNSSLRLARNSSGRVPA